jgi:hypothetical protein
MLKMLIKHSPALVLATALAAPASAGTLFKWTAPDGSVSYTDEAKRIPEHFRSSAKRVRVGSLGDYPRYTPRDSHSRVDYEERLHARLERLRELNRPAPAAAPEPVPQTQTLLRLNPRMSIAVPNDRIDLDEPVIVNQQRVMEPGGIATTHVTVVRQGGRVISVVHPESTQSSGSWGDMADLLED